MAKVKCPCCGSFAHTSGQIPNPNEWLMFADMQFPDPETQIKAGLLYSQAMHAFRCVDCDAVAVFWNGLEASPVWYRPVLRTEE